MKSLLIFRRTVRGEYIKDHIGDLDGVTITAKCKRIDESKPYKLKSKTYLPIGEKLFKIYDKIHWSFLDKIVDISRCYDAYKYLCECYKIQDMQYRYIVDRFTEEEIIEEAKKIQAYYKYKLQNNKTYMVVDLEYEKGGING